MVDWTKLDWNGGLDWAVNELLEPGKQEEKLAGLAKGRASECPERVARFQQDTAASKKLLQADFI